MYKMLYFASVSCVLYQLEKLNKISKQNNSMSMICRPNTKLDALKVPSNSDKNLLEVILCIIITSILQ
jgi:hypothetical protein